MESDGTAAMAAAARTGFVRRERQTAEGVSRGAATRDMIGVMTYLYNLRVGGIRTGKGGEVREKQRKVKKFGRGEDSEDEDRVRVGVETRDFFSRAVRDVRVRRTCFVRRVMCEQP